MPEAYAGYAAPTARVPRTLWAHTHEDGANDYPPVLNLSTTHMAYVIIPDNWNGLDKLYLWLLGAGAEQITINVTVDIGTCDEAYNIHTQTVNGLTPTLAANEYECVDLTTTHAAVLANLAARDVIRVTVTHVAGDEAHMSIGIELQET